MSGSWFTDEDRGELRVVERDGSWYVADSDGSGETRCIFRNEFDPDGSEHTIDVEIVNYREGTGDSTNFLTVSVKEEASRPTSQNPNHTDSTTSVSDATPETSNRATTSRDRYPERNLVQFEGSGEYVTVEAAIAEIEYVKKNTSDMPDFRGVLRERGSTKRLPFVVENGVGHPYFETGKRFRFVGVKDHTYQHKNEVQALVTERTEFVEL